MTVVSNRIEGRKLPLLVKRYLAIVMWCSEDKLNRKKAQLRLPSVVKTSRVLRFPFVLARVILKYSNEGELALQVNIRG